VNKLVPPEEEDKRHGRRPVKAKPGQQTGASHSSNRPTNEKNREAERRRQKQSGGNSSVVATSDKPAAPRSNASKSKSRKSR
jgi:hypothetical protein